MARHLPIDSAYNRAREPELYAFGTDIKRAAILADIFDNVSMMRYEFAVAHSEKSKTPDMPAQYVTPWNGQAGGGASRRKGDPYGADPLNGTYGSGAIPVSQFNDFYYGGGDE